MGLLDILRGVADQADFLPGFDPVKDKRGLLSQLLSGREQYGQTPPIVQPGTMQPANAVQKNPPMMSAPGGANPYAEFAKPRGILKRMITPNSLDRQYDAKHMAFLEHRDMAAKAKQAAAAATAQREQRLKQGREFGLSGRDLLSFAASGQVPQHQIFKQGDSVLGDDGSFNQAPSLFTSQKNALGQNVSFNPNTGSYGDPTGPVERQSLSPGQNLIDSETGAVIGQNNTPTSSMVSVTNNLPSNKGESAFQTERGKSASSKMDAINSAGDAAASAIADADMMNSLIDQIDYTGMGSETLMNIQKAGRMLGLDIGDDVPAKEAAVRLTAKLGLALKSDLPGPMSDGDRQFLLSIPPNIGTTRAGNKALVFMMKKKAQFEQDMQASLNRANPQTMEEFYAWERDFRASYPPLFDEASKRDLMAAIGAGQ